MEHFYMDIEAGSGDYFPQLYRKGVDYAANNGKIVEVGCWKGRSSAFLAVEIVNSGKNLSLDCIDIWEYPTDYLAAKMNIEVTPLYQVFLNNMKPVEGFYKSIKLPSVEAAKLYEDNSLDFISIDANHEYEYVKDDILAWYPKLKIGGIMGGDDYHHTWPGVVKAVNEFFPGTQKPDSISWNITKTNEKL